MLFGATGPPFDAQAGVDSSEPEAEGALSLEIFDNTELESRPPEEWARLAQAGELRAQYPKRGAAGAGRRARGGARARVARRVWPGPKGAQPRAEGVAPQLALTREDAAEVTGVEAELVVAGLAGTSPVGSR